MTVTAEKAPVEMAAEDMPKPHHAGTGPKPSEETVAMLALGVGKGLIWSPCFDHQAAKGGSCLALKRLAQTYKVRQKGNPSLKFRYYHTKDGALCVIRLA